MDDNYEQAILWLRLMRNSAYTEKDRKIIEWIEEIVWRYNDMGNS